MNSDNASKNVKCSFDTGLAACSILSPQSSEVLVVNVENFLTYLKTICLFVLNSINIDQLFTDDLSHDSIERFIKCNRCRTLFIAKKYSTTKDSLSSSVFNLYAISNQDYKIKSNWLSFILLKRNGCIVDDENYHKQLRMIHLIDSNKSKQLFGFSLDRLRIYLPEIFLTTDVFDKQAIGKLIRSLIASTNRDLYDNHENHTGDDKNENDIHDDENEKNTSDDENEEEEDMSIFTFSFTAALDNNHRARVYDAILAFSTRTGGQNRANIPIQVRRIADPACIYQPNEEFNVVLYNQASYICFQAWLVREYRGCQHVLTIVEPASFAMDVIV